jgi:2-oxoglutarate ferredoxin oxidoreductase subunit beta
VQNASFVAQAVDWIPDLMYDIVSAAFHHKGFSFVRILQRCPVFMPKVFDSWLNDTQKSLILTHEDGIRPSAAISKIYRNQEEHDPSNIDRAREIASCLDPVPVGILYRNPAIPCYEEIRGAGAQRPAGMVQKGLEAEFDKFTVWPEGQQPAA